MAENQKFEVGDRIAIDKQEDVLVVALRCPLCVAAGNTEAVLTPATRVWVPALLKRWIPKWEQEKFISLEEAILKAPAFASLVEEGNGRKEGKRVCNKHGRMLRDAKVWTSQLSWVMRKQAEAAERKALSAFGSIASILGGQRELAAGESQSVEPEGEDADADARAEQDAIQRRTLAASRKKSGQDAEPKGKGKAKAHATKVPTKGRAKGKLQAEIADALAGDEPTED